MSLSPRSISYPDEDAQSYEKGNISRYVSLLKIGDKARIRGPKGFFKYSPSLAREIGMIAGGTGITPMLQIIRAALKNPADNTRLRLIYANVNVEDILLKKELDDLVAAHPRRFSVYYVLNNAPQGWAGGVGFVSKEQIDKYLPRTADDIKLLMCGMCLPVSWFQSHSCMPLGPPPMMTAMKYVIPSLCTAKDSSLPGSTLLSSTFLPRARSASSRTR